MELPEGLMGTSIDQRTLILSCHYHLQNLRKGLVSLVRSRNFLTPVSHFVLEPWIFSLSFWVFRSLPVGGAVSIQRTLLHDKVSYLE